ncbi:DUF2141 domain-containing protein [Luteimonas suaedae]|uniref:DUF2141 domain-containing protein n=1 Tax=Luteimonas suaedae TaxID=2605430 RepID=UPI0011EBF1ED|nr:DUF2141 domain-containing protein [Luteimonas suaedae]
MTRFVLATLLLPAIACTPAAWAADLEVRLQGLRSQDGSVRVSVVDSAAGWDGEAAPVAAQQLTATGNAVRMHVADLAPGAYAVMAFHDENGNGRLDTNLVGMPVEGYGFSNNPQVMRKPTFDEARFDLGADDLVLDIAIR